MKALRCGYTTGACAAACALASCLWQRDGRCPQQVEIMLPAGQRYVPEIRPLSPGRCAVTKDAGDDPDVTDGCEVWAEAEILEEDGPVTFLAGEGVGTVTLPGLALAPGEAAVNPVPRRMIEEAVRSVIGARAARVTVGITDMQSSVPGLTAQLDSLRKRTRRLLIAVSITAIALSALVSYLVCRVLGS